MVNMNQAPLDKLLVFVKERFSGDSSGHDYFHTLRVYKMALALQKQEGGDEEIITYASLLHDVDDHKLFPDGHAAKDYLEGEGFAPEKVERILKIIGDVSYKGNDSVSPNTIEGQIVQDADRLDAIGAIGIARAFAYGGSKHRVMHDPDIKPKLDMNGKETFAHEGTSVNHFYEKLLKLKGMMNTKTAKKIAEGRSKYMEDYLEEFFAEWNALDVYYK